MKPFSEICTGCGQCCRLAYLLPDFPEPIDENGVCVHLKNNKCAIYENRPLICRVDDYYKANKKGSKKKYRKKTIETCNRLVKEFNLDDKYLIT